MALFKKSASKNKSGQSAERTGWVAQEGGYESTSSPELIKNILTQLKNNRRLLTVVQEGYQSGGTILIGVDQEQVLIDKPQDWPGDKLKAVVVFRDADRIRHHFQSRVLSVTGETVYLQFPKRLLRLQRREHYRVELPPASTARFLYGERSCRFQVRDVSAGGMLVCAESSQGIAEPGCILEDITITVPSSEDEQEGGHEGGTFQVGKGEVVRRSYNQDSLQYLIGVRFMAGDTEKKDLMHYIRKRELEILRKGIK